MLILSIILIRITYNWFMPLQTLFFDLDDTLYDSSCGLWEAIRERMGRYMLERLRLPASEIPRLRHHYFTTYGTTLRGLQIHHQVDPREYLAYVHDLPVRDFLQPDPGLRSLLERLPQHKLIFTNADAAHAEHVLQVLGVRACFEKIVDVTALDYACKPEPRAYRSAMQIAGENDAINCLLVDDSARNLAPARALGFTTVLVGSGLPDAAAHFSISAIKELPRVLPQLWNGTHARDLEASAHE